MEDKTSQSTQLATRTVPQKRTLPDKAEPDTKKYKPDSNVPIVTETSETVLDLAPKRESVWKEFVDQITICAENDFVDKGEDEGNFSPLAVLSMVKAFQEQYPICNDPVFRNNMLNHLRSYAALVSTFSQPEETGAPPPTITEQSSFAGVLKYLEFKFSDKITNSKVWSLALDIIKEQEIDGSILFGQSGPVDLLNMLTGDAPQNYGIPTTPARAIATHIHELKEKLILQKLGQEGIGSSFGISSKTSKGVLERLGFSPSFIEQHKELKEQAKIFNLCHPLLSQKCTIQMDLKKLHRRPEDCQYEPRYCRREHLLFELLSLFKNKRTEERKDDLKELVVPQVPMDTGSDKPTIIALAGGKGRGKTRALLELASALQKSHFVILVTYNSFSCGSYRSRKNDESPRDFAAQDLAARVAYSFYRQMLVSENENPMSWSKFGNQFSQWQLEQVMDTISNYLRKYYNYILPHQKLLLVDELLTVCSLSEEKFNHSNNPCLIEVLQKLAQGCEARSDWDYVVSSLDEFAFEDFMTSSQRKLSFLPLPLLTVDDSIEIFKHAVQQGGATIRKWNDARLKVLATYSGGLPRHVATIAHIVNNNARSWFSLLLDTEKPFNNEENTKKMIQFCAERCTISIPFAEQQDGTLDKLLPLLILFFLSPKASRQYSLTCALFKCLPTITVQTLANWGLLLPQINSKDRVSRLFPSFMAIICQCRNTNFSNIASQLVNMCTLNVRSGDGLQNEQFHILWLRVRLTLLQKLGKESVSFSKIYNLSKVFNPHCQSLEPFLVRKEYLDALMVPAIGTELQIEDGSLPLILLEDSPQLSIFTCKPGQKGFEAFMVAHPTSKILPTQGHEKIKTGWENGGKLAIFHSHLIPHSILQNVFSNTKAKFFFFQEKLIFVLNVKKVAKFVCKNSSRACLIIAQKGQIW